MKSKWIFMLAVVFKLGGATVTARYTNSNITTSVTIASFPLTPYFSTM